MEGKERKGVISISSISMTRQKTSYHKSRTQAGNLVRIIDCPFSPLDCIVPVGMESGLISDDQISASSQLDDNHAPKRARLNTKMSGIKQGGWLPLTNDRNQWLQVDLNSYTRVTRVATQGMDGYEQWVTSFQLEYSINEITFKSYMESVGNPKVCGAYQFSAELP